MNAKEVKERLLSEIGKKIDGENLSCSELKELCGAWEHLTSHDIFENMAKGLQGEEEGGELN